MDQSNPTRAIIIVVTVNMGKGYGRRPRGDSRGQAAVARPASIASLAETTGRKPGNLSRTLKTMAHYGIVEMRREKRFVRPVVTATAFRIVAA